MFTVFNYTTSIRATRTSPRGGRVIIFSYSDYTLVEKLFSLLLRTLLFFLPGGAGWGETSRQDIHREVSREVGAGEIRAHYRKLAVRLATLLRERMEASPQLRAAFELVHGLKYVFPASPGPVSQGLPTALSAAPLAGKIIATTEDRNILKSLASK